MNESFSTKIIDIFKSFKVWLLVILLVLAFFAVNYNFSGEGVVINGVVPGSLGEKAGIEFNSKGSLGALEQVISINGVQVNSVEEFYSKVDSLPFNKTFVLSTNKNVAGYKILLSESVNVSKDKLVGISVRDKPMSNVKLGIELEGGSRLILKPLKNLSDVDYDLLVNVLQNRLDVYGASGTKVNKLEDAFSGEKFIFVESTSSNKNEIYELISRQGNFEAKIKNVTVFTGNNILRVFSDPQHARFQGCSQGSGEFVCSYSFSVEINELGSNAFFNQTKTLGVVNGNYLSEKVYFYLDGKEITGLNIASSFKYQKVNTPQITVSGNPMPSEKLALASSQKEMKFLQAILSTQSLPSELEVVQSYSISNSQGSAFLSNAIFVGIISLFAVTLVLAIRYRHVSIFISLVIVLLAEILLLFGISAFMSLTIDLAAIGGIIATIGSGVNDNTIITDEYYRKRTNTLSSKKKMDNAFIIILMAFSTLFVAMVPFLFAGIPKVIVNLVMFVVWLVLTIFLFITLKKSSFWKKSLISAGLGTFIILITPVMVSPVLILLKGFAFTIIIGLFIGVFITRPVYAQILRILVTTREERKEEDENEKS